MLPPASVHICEDLWITLTLHLARSCRKIGGKAAVQQSRSRRARRTQSPRMPKVTVHGETKEPIPATALHAITTARRPDNVRSSALVQSLSTQFMASPSCELTSRCSEIGFTFSPFSHRFYTRYTRSSDVGARRCWCLRSLCTCSSATGKNAHLSIR